MLELNNKIKVHIYDTNNRKINTDDHNTIYTVCSKGGKMGINYNINKSLYISNGDIFVPFEGFASRVIFEDVENGNKYHFDNLSNSIKQIA